MFQPLQGKQSQRQCPHWWETTVENNSTARQWLHSVTRARHHNCPCSHTAPTFLDRCAEIIVPLKWRNHLPQTLVKSARKRALQCAWPGVSAESLTWFETVPAAKMWCLPCKKKKKEKKKSAFAASGKHWSAAVNVRLQRRCRKNTSRFWSCSKKGGNLACECPQIQISQLLTYL